jgi:ribonuclease P protein component
MAEPGKTRLRFTPDDRLRKSWEFRQVQGKGRKVHTHHYLLIVLPRPQPTTSLRSRLGITVTRKVSPSAVKRNRVKRIVREVFRRNRDLFPSGCDVVVIARKGAPEIGYHEALAEIGGASRAMHEAGRRR